jgi:lactate permease
VGIPLTTLSSVTGLDLAHLSAMTGRQLPVFSFIVPFWLIAAQAGFRGMREVWPACLVCGGAFAATQFAVSNYHGPWLVDIISAVVAMAALVFLLRVWRPPGEAEKITAPVRRPELRPWMPWLVLSLFVGLWTTPFAKTLLNGYPPSTKPVSTWQAPIIPVPALAGNVQKMPPVAPHPEIEKAAFTFNYLSATGTALLIAGFVSAGLLGIGVRDAARIYWRTILRVRISLLTIALMMALGYTTRYSGTDTTMGLAFAATGTWFPFFSPLLGWLGVALTGSDTSSNVLFGNLQKTTAEQLNISPILTCSANTTGGVMGKMIDAQSIVVAQTATGGGPDAPDAGTILRAVFWHSLSLALLVGVLVWLQARVWPWMIPGG